MNLHESDLRYVVVVGALLLAATAATVDIADHWPLDSKSCGIKINIHRWHTKCRCKLEDLKI